MKRNSWPTFCVAIVLFTVAGCWWGWYSGDWAQIDVDRKLVYEAEQPVGEFYVDHSPRAMPPLEVWRRKK